VLLLLLLLLLLTLFCGMIVPSADSAVMTAMIPMALGSDASSLSNLRLTILTRSG
jgi:hypothetical protein